MSQKLLNIRRISLNIATLAEKAVDEPELLEEIEKRFKQLEENINWKQ